MANKRITLTLEESLVKTFEDEYGDLKTWLKSEFLMRARMSKKRIIDTKVKEILESNESLEIPSTESEILDKYFNDKKAAKEKAQEQKASEAEAFNDTSNLKEKLRRDKEVAKAAESASETSSGDV